MLNSSSTGNQPSSYLQLGRNLTFDSCGKINQRTIYLVHLGTCILVSGNYQMMHPFETSNLDESKVKVPGDYNNCPSVIIHSRGR